MSESSEESFNKLQYGCIESDASSSNFSTTTNTQSSATEQKEKLVQRESRYVLYLRLVVVLVLLLAAITVSIVVYLITEDSQRESMESNYNAAAMKVLETYMNIADEKIGAAASLVVTIVAEGHAVGDSWPFLTLTAFQERAATIMKLSGALYIGIDPIVTSKQREEWEYYTNYGKDAGWYQDAREYQRRRQLDVLDRLPQIETDDTRLNLTTGVANYIYDLTTNTSGKAVISLDADWYLPIWQYSPITSRCMVNQNRRSNSEASSRAMRDMKVVFEGMKYSSPGFVDDPNPSTAEMAWLLHLANGEATEYQGDIYTPVYFPLYHNFSANRTSAGVMRIIIHWARYFQKILPSSKRGIIIVLDNSCDEAFTYKIDGPNVIPLGHGDLHDKQYDDFERTATFADVVTISDGTASGMALDTKTCPYSIRVYPSEEFMGIYKTNTPFVVTFAVAAVFAFATVMFFVYDNLVERRQKNLMRKATQTHDIVASLFPKSVRDRLLQDADQKQTDRISGPASRVRNFLVDGDQGVKDDNEAPIADLFPNATVLFADISGFTAWSSSREPSQVFILLQSVYQAFDDIAKRRKVFKVETIGDSYVAVTGLPNPQPNHAIIMVRFASDCLNKLREVTRCLETTLGPDTSDLSMRIGIHSGPVTAGVLRGQRSRFQLFGDTVNTASRMESTGFPGKIQASQQTADLLINSGKEHWVLANEDSVVAKGKGVLKTCWVNPNTRRTGSTRSSQTGRSEGNTQMAHFNAKMKGVMRHERLIDWMVEVLQDSLRSIVSHRLATNKPCTPLLEPSLLDCQTALDEIVEAIQLSGFDSKAVIADARAVVIPTKVTELLREYVAIIASAYKDNPFHNFEHACHVTMCVSKFLKRIVTPDLDVEELGNTDDHNHVAKQVASHLHDYTYGIHSDPVAVFGIVFAALIHDVDHRGVSNVQLMKEEPAMKAMFRGKSIAEQNSLEIAWDLFMSAPYQELRAYMFANTEELMRFRQVIVNVVLATDIFDKELNELRKARWQKAFAENNTKDDLALRATIVIEHIIQASDVCHTMQHWHIYRKWNQRLFYEMLTAFRAGRMGGDPASFWYQGELNFFDNYIIPLSQKLKECNVFGVSSDECLNYAIRNRAEWEARGQDIVQEMLQEYVEAST